MTNFKNGDRIRWNAYGRTATGTVRGVGLSLGSSLAVEVDAVFRKFTHDCWGRCPKGTGEFVDPALAVLIEPTPKRQKPSKVFAPDSQNGRLLAHLAGGNKVTRIVADHMFGIASLTRRIRDLRDAGHNITSTWKVDPRGNTYVEYQLTSKPMRKVF